MISPKATNVIDNINYNYYNVNNYYNRETKGILNMYTEDRKEEIRLQVIDYLRRNKISPSSLAVIIKMRPQTLKSFLDSSKSTQFVTLTTIEQWLEEYDHVDFRISKNK